MDQKLKERVFGALVVVAIAVIFIPMVLDNKHEEAMNLSESIPTPPVADADQLTASPDAIAELEASLDEMPSIDIPQKAPVQAAAEKPQIVASKKPAPKPAKTAAVEEIQAARQAEKISEAKDAAPKLAVKEAAPTIAAKAEAAAPKVAQVKVDKAPISEAKLAKAKPVKDAVPIATRSIPSASLALEDDFMAANDVTGMSRVSGSFSPSARANRTEEISAKKLKNIAAAPKVEKPVAKVAVAPVEKKIEKPVAKVAVAPVEKKTVAPIAHNEAVQSGWAVQIGAFSNPDNARALQNKLKKQGYSVVLHEIASNNRTITRVLVGPKTARGEADQLRANLEAKTNVSGVVIRYEPLA